ncbi:hypothetical protein [Bacillus sp. CGMCC 1.16541]|uniref:hypothetical protein n=1 Tax=Bacillus sp. CGMCC 1.16541 TaxID=2185143 RepID=UPI000D729257|nr:hypothetical protein [Bacillus sp. CGMCC 1.16541]
MIVSSFQQLFQQEVMKQGKKLHLSQGDFVQGKILKLFSNHTALVHINGMSLVAKLEAALSVQHPYWFEVKETTANGPQLKVLSHAAPSSLDYGVNHQQAALLKELGVPVTKRNNEFVAFFMEKGLPLSKQRIGELMNLFTDDGMTVQDKQVVEQLVKMRLPVISETFKALSAVQREYHLSSDLVKLQQLLLQDNNEKLLPLQKMVETFIKPLSIQEGEETLTLAMKTWLSHSDHEHANKAFSLLQQAKLIPEGWSEQNVIEHMANYVKKIDSQSAQPLVTKNAIYEHFFTSNTMLQGMKQSPLLTVLEDMLASLYMKDGQNIEHIDLKSKLHHLGSLALTDDLSSLLHVQNNEGKENKPFYRAFMQVLQSLGLQHEGDVVASLQNEKAYTHSLKSLLLQVQHTTSSVSVLEVVDQLIHKLTGIQLLNQEQGPLTTIYMQMPFQLGQSLHDITVQWNGRKKENGQIDPNYCHILFYLHLDQMKETIIDVLVQNRVITVNVINESFEKVSPLAETMKVRLQEELHKLNYQLSTVKVSRTINRDVKQLGHFPASTHYKYEGGLDIRV